MDYIVFDLEWNQNPAGGSSAKDSLTFEIIEIGAVKLTKKGEVLGEFQSYIKPKVYKQLHYMTKEVTKIQMGDLLSKGRPFPEVVKEFLDWCGGDYRFCTWGSMDLEELQNNCDYYHIKGLLQKPLFYYDLQKLFSLQFEDGKNRRSLKSAVELLQLPERQSFHNAVSDAQYTADIFGKLNMECYGAYFSVDYHQIPSDKKEELTLNFGTYCKFISREFSSKETAMKDKRVIATTCYQCGRSLRKKIRWFTHNGKIFYAAAYCPEHGWLKAKVRMKKGRRGGVFVVKTEKLVEESVVDTIRAKQIELRNKRRERRHRLEMTPENN